MILLSKYVAFEYLLWKYNSGKTKLSKPENWYLSDASNESRNLVYKLETEGKTLIIKQFGPDITDRKLFFESEKLSFENKIQKNLLEADLDNSILIYEINTEYQDITSFFAEYKEESITRPEKILILNKFIIELAKIHEINIPVLKNRIESKFKNEIEFWSLINLNKYFKRYYSYFIKSYKKDSLVHFDIKQENILYGCKSLKLIDFEMMEYGDCYVDYAGYLSVLCHSLFDISFLKNSMPEKIVSSICYLFTNTLNENIKNRLDVDKLKAFFAILNYRDFKTENAYFSNIDLIFEYLKK